MALYNRHTDGCYLVVGFCDAARDDCMQDFCNLLSAILILDLNTFGTQVVNSPARAGESSCIVS